MAADQPTSGQQPSTWGQIATGLSAPALAIVLAGTPRLRALAANAGRIAPREMATMEASRLPFFMREVPQAEAARGIGGGVTPQVTSMGPGEFEALVKHPRAAEVRRGDPWVNVELPAETAEGTTGTSRLGKTEHPLRTTVQHEMQHAAGGAETLEKATKDGKRPRFADWYTGALHQPLQAAPSTGSEVVAPAMKDFPDLAHMYAQYRSQGFDAGVSIGELLNEYIARVRSGLPRSQNMMFGPWSGIGNEKFFAPRLAKFQPELEQITANQMPGSSWFSGPHSQNLFGIGGWDVLTKALQDAASRRR